MASKPRRGRSAMAPLLLAAAMAVAALDFLRGPCIDAYVPAPPRLGTATSARLGQRPPASGSRDPSVARGFFANPFEPQPEPKKEEPPVVIKEDYTLSAVFLGVGATLCALLPFVGFGIGLLILLLGILFYVQTGRIRFVFDGDAFELKTADAGAELQKSGENIVVGGENRWKYASFVNWEFFPKGFVENGLPPVLVYFKETQTPKQEWNTGPGAAANSEEALASGAVPGQVHFFPCICDAQQMKAEFEKRGCQKLPA
mmetsp:Transcript_73604/g.204561  ORF Transcript_73604/g.204561 Transcript_73604/m.204561 type:complete len:258 (+) Transcript_73604:53-826(+)